MTNRRDVGLYLLFRKTQYFLIALLIVLGYFPDNVHSSHLHYPTTPFHCYVILYSCCSNRQYLDAETCILSELGHVNLIFEIPLLRILILCENRRLDVVVFLVSLPVSKAVWMGSPIIACLDVLYCGIFGGDASHGLAKTGGDGAM